MFGSQYVNTRIASGTGTSITSESFTLAKDSQTLTMVGTGLDNGRLSGRGSRRRQALRGLFEREAVLPVRVERDPEHGSERRMLDHHDREVGTAGQGVLHAEHHDRLVDDDQLQRELGNEPGFLAGGDKPTHALGRGAIVEERELVNAA